MKVLLLLCSCLLLPGAFAQGLEQAIARVKPAVVGIGSQLKTRTPPIQFIGTGFATGDGLSVLTCAHVIEKLLDRKSVV